MTSTAEKQAPDLDLLDRRILNIIQSAFPLVEEPYKAIADEVGATEQEVLLRISELKRRNLVRQISAIFDTRRVGYRTSLVAFAFLPDRLHKGALRINKHPGVSHNYAREGSYFNLWFTLAVPPNEDLGETVERLARETGAAALRILPTVRFFKIGVNFDMLREESAAHKYYSPDGYAPAAGAARDAERVQDWNRAEPLSERDIMVIQAMQEDLPLAPRPFDEMAAGIGLTPNEMFAHARRLEERGVMRRYSAVLHHRRAGFKANAMVVWKVPQERSVEVGKILASHPAVSHCYERPVFPDWPYSHFSMVHATSKTRCEEIAAELSRMTGIMEYLALYSNREYKKTRVRYFVKDSPAA